MKFTIFGLMLFLAACNGSDTTTVKKIPYTDPTVTAKATNVQPVVMIIGDSISLGYTPYVQQELDGRYIAFHSEGLDSTTGKENDQSTTVSLEHIHQWLKDTGPVNIIHCNWGLWDIYSVVTHSQTPIEVYQSNLESLAAILQSTGAKIVWATTTPVPSNSGPWTEDKIIRYNEVLIEVAKEHGFEIDDLHALMLPYQYLHISRSNIHYVPEGYELISYQVSNSIE